MTNRVLEFGTAKAGPGERGTGYIKVGELCDGSPVNMPVIILNASTPARWGRWTPATTSSPGCWTR